MSLTSYLYGNKKQPEVTARDDIKSIKYNMKTISVSTPYSEGLPSIRLNSTSFDILILIQRPLKHRIGRT